MIALTIRSLFKLAGPRISAISVLTIPVGIVLGLVEIAMGLSLQNLLISFELLESSSQGPAWFIDIMDPVALVLVLAGALLALRYLAQFLPGYVLEAFAVRIRRLLATRALGFGGAVGDLSIADLTHILSNLLGRSTGFLNGAMNTVIAVVVLLTIVFGMFALSTELALITLGLVVVFGLPLVFLRHAFQRYATNVYQYQTAFTQRLIKSAKNILFVNLSGVVNVEREHLSRDIDAIFANHIRFAIRYCGNAVWPNFMAIVIVVLIMVFNHRYVFIEMATLVPFIYLLSRFAGAVSQIAVQTGELQYSYPFVRDLLEYSDNFVERNVPDESCGNVDVGAPHGLRVVGLTVGRDKTLLKDVNFELSYGDTLLIVGPSGRGKSTLLMTLVGLIPQRQGEIYWNDTPIQEIAKAPLRRQIGYSGSEPFLFDGTIRENLNYGMSALELSDETYREALHIAQCDFVWSLDGQLDHRLKESGEGISAGQKQRLSIARAILRQPDVLLLDEATANLDEDTEAKIFEDIRTCFPNLVIVVISHRDSLQKYATATISV